MTYQEKIERAQGQITRLQAEIEKYSGMARQITEVENGREIDSLNQQIAKWTALVSETPEETAERKEAEHKEAERLEWLNNNFAELERNDWDY